MAHPRLFIGTAGWSIPRAVADAFSGVGTHLERYAATLSAVELNSSFYRPHRRTTYERWAASTPDDFRFSVKLPKEISHARKLVDTARPLAAFVEEIGGLGSKLRVVLVQLPPSLAFDQRIALTFLSSLREHIGPEVAIACEPRHATWFGDVAERLLTDLSVARVAADPVLADGGEQPGGWRGLRYHRLHGSPRIYYSAYGIERLAALAGSIGQAADLKAETWCVFDNTASGAALGDALCLRSST